MKLFIDSANVEEIREANSFGIIEGVTTNPSLIAREGRDFLEVLYEIATIVNGPVSAEVISEDAKGMVEEARFLTRIHKNIIVKIPMTIEGIRAVKTLRRTGIDTNVTLVFSPSQALLAAKAGATYISPFVGRLDDASESGMDLVSLIMDLYNNYDFETQVIVASVRNPLHVVEAALIGADVATVPFRILKQLFHHPLTDAGIRRFKEDWEKVPDMAIIPRVKRFLKGRERGGI